MTAADVIAMAPDAAAVKAGEALASTRKWLVLASDAELLWGECQGSGKTPYQVCADLATLAYRCTCPSRKFPCKHVLGALLAHVNGSAVPGAPPEWIRAWRSERQTKQNRAAQRAAAAADGTNKDESASAAGAVKRAQSRERRVDAGVAECELWLRDLVRLGLAHARIQPPAFWEGRAARLVDAQCPGLARRVRALAGIIVADGGWEDRTLAALGDIALVCAAYARIDVLAPERRADVRRAIGWTQSQDEVAARAFDVVTDTWTVIGVLAADEERLTMRRTWLQSSRDGRAALVLQFAPKGAPFGESLGAAGACFDATLTYFESAAPLRAGIAQRAGLRTDARIPRARTIDAALDEYARALAGDPWLDRVPFVLADVTPLRVSETIWYLRDADATVRLARGAYDPYALLALSGGNPLCVSGEWDGDALLPCGVWTQGRVVGLGS